MDGHLLVGKSEVRNLSSTKCQTADRKVYYPRQRNNEFQFLKNIDASEADISKNNWLIKSADISEIDSKNEVIKDFILETNFNVKKINSLFSNLSSLSIFQLYKLKKDYKSLGYSTVEVDTHILKIISYPIYLMIMTIFSSIIMLNIKRN